MNAGMVADAAAAAAQAAGGGAARSGMRTVTLAEVAVLDQLVAGFSPARQLEIGRKLLEQEQVITSPIVRGPLAAIRSGLGDVQAQDVRISTLLDNVRTSIDQQIANIDGAGTPVWTQGQLVHHPDYSAVGAIRDNLRLLDRFGVI